MVAGVGLWERATRQLVFARDLEVGNAYESFFRTASLLRDPSIYGRHLVVAILVVLVGLWLTRLSMAAGAAVIAFLALALFFTYSQSSMVALVIGVLFVAAAAGTGRTRTVVLVGALAPLLLASAVLAAVGQDESLLRVTGGRSDLVANSTDIVREHPLGGVGIGARGEGRARSSGNVGTGSPSPRTRRRSRWRRSSASSESPSTSRSSWRRHGSSISPGYATACSASAPRWSSWRSSCSSLFYSGFFEDPLVWLSLGLAGAVVAKPLAD